jgi:hypothetical protein
LAGSIASLVFVGCYSVAVGCWLIRIALLADLTLLRLAVSCYLLLLLLLLLAVVVVVAVVLASLAVSCLYIR